MLRSALIFLFLGAVPLSAQQTSPKVDSLIARTYRGDASARQQLGGITRGMITDLVTHRVDAPTARATAQAAMAMAYPMSPIDSPLTKHDFEWRPGAVRSLRAALAADSGDLWSATHLENIAPYPYLWLDADKELQLFRALGRRHPDLAGELAATRIRLELEIGSVDSATRALEALPSGGLSLAQRKYLDAEVLFAKGKEMAASQTYFAGAKEIADSGDAAAYFLSIKSIAKPGERDEWKSLGYGSGVREKWLQTFWSKRDLEDARALGTRLPEQFRRWRVALQQYRFDQYGSLAEALPIPRTATASTIRGEAGLDDILFPQDTAVADLAYINRFLPLSRVVDDRGLMVLRLGEPLRSVGSSGVHVLEGANLLWAGPEGPFVIGFSRAGGFAGDLRWGMVARNQPVGDIMAVCQIDARLCVLAGLVQVQPGVRPVNSSNRIRMNWTEARIRAEARDGNPESFTHSLDAVVEAYGIPQGGTLVVIAVPVRGLIRGDGAREVARDFATRIRVVVGDTTKGQVLSSLDTLRHWRSGETVGKDAYLNAYFVVPAPIGTWSVSVVVGDTTHAAGTGRRFRAVPIVAFDGKALELSDPILGREGSGLSWRHGTESVPLNPTNAWRTDESVILSYETDGMTPGHEYQTRYELWKTSGNPKSPSLVISGTAVASAARASTRRELALKELSAGDYRLVVRVRDTTNGREVTRERRIAVRK